ncbi:MAG: hypothetical protein Q9200_002172 [Gallowayella weberi]
MSSTSTSSSTTPISRSSTTSTSTTSSSSTTSATSTPQPTLASFCLQNTATLQFASLSRNGNGLSFNPTSPKTLPSLFTLDSQFRLTSRVTGLIAALDLPTFGKDGSDEGHITGIAAAEKNPTTEFLVCDAGISGSFLKCRSAANYIDPAKTPATRSQLYTTTKGNDGVDRYVFAPNTATPIKILPAAACGPNYS